MIKKYFIKKPVMAKEYDKDSGNTTKCWIWYNIYADGDFKVRDHCHMIEKYRGCPHRYYNINVKLNHKTPTVFNKHLGLRFTSYYARTTKTYF